MTLATDPLIPPATGARLERNLNADVIRALGIWMVVFLHVAAAIAVSFNSTPRDAWWVSNIVDSLCRPCVPFFILLSGYFLLDPTKEESTRTFFFKRLRKVIIPLLVWAVIYIGWDALINHEPYTLMSAIASLINGPVYFHLWYLYALVGIYLAAPILRVYVRAASRRDLIYFLILWAVAVGLIPVANRLLNLKLGVTFVVTTGLVGYFVAGQLLRDIRLAPRLLWIPAALYLLGGVFIMLSTFYLTLNEGGKLDQYYMDYTSPPVIVMSLSGFVLLNSLPFDRILASRRWLKALIVGFSVMSLGIYLIHVIVIEGMHYHQGAPKYSTSAVLAIFTILRFSLVGLAVSYIAVYILRKLPVIRAIVP